MFRDSSTVNATLNPKPSAVRCTGHPAPITAAAHPGPRHTLRLRLYDLYQLQKHDF